MTSTSLVWFRKDLRLLDNVAFAKALGQHVHVILICSKMVVVSQP